MFNKLHFYNLQFDFKFETFYLIVIICLLFVSLRKFTFLSQDRCYFNSIRNIKLITEVGIIEGWSNAIGIKRKLQARGAGIHHNDDIRHA